MFSAVVACILVWSVILSSLQHLLSDVFTSHLLTPSYPALISCCLFRIGARVPITVCCLHYLFAIKYRIDWNSRYFTVCGKLFNIRAGCNPTDHNVHAVSRDPWRASGACVQLRHGGWQAVQCQVVQERAGVLQVHTYRYSPYCRLSLSWNWRWCKLKLIENWWIIPYFQEYQSTETKIILRRVDLFTTGMFR